MQIHIEKLVSTLALGLLSIVSSPSTWAKEPNADTPESGVVAVPTNASGGQSGVASAAKSGNKGAAQGDDEEESEDDDDDFAPDDDLFEDDPFEDDDDF